jgi:hypothetical protein
MTHESGSFDIRPAIQTTCPLDKIGKAFVLMSKNIFSGENNLAAYCDFALRRISRASANVDIVIRL